MKARSGPSPPGMRKSVIYQRILQDSHLRPPDWKFRGCGSSGGGRACRHRLRHSCLPGRRVRAGVQARTGAFQMDDGMHPGPSLPARAAALAAGHGRCARIVPPVRLFPPSLPRKGGWAFTVRKSIREPEAPPDRICRGTPHCKTMWYDRNGRRSTGVMPGNSSRVHPAPGGGRGVTGPCPPWKPVME